MNWFGESWDAPVCDPAEHGPTPEGKSCARCGVAIRGGDRGFELPYVDGYEVEYQAWHLACLLGAIGVKL